MFMNRPMRRFVPTGPEAPGAAPTGPAATIPQSQPLPPPNFSNMPPQAPLQGGAAQNRWGGSRLDRIGLGWGRPTGGRWGAGRPQFTTDMGMTRPRRPGFGVRPQFLEGGRGGPRPGGMFRPRRVPRLPGPAPMQGAQPEQQAGMQAPVRQYRQLPVIQNPVGLRPNNPEERGLRL